MCIIVAAISVLFLSSNCHCWRYHFLCTSKSAELLRSVYSTPWIQPTISRIWCMYAYNYIKVHGS